MEIISRNIDGKLEAVLYDEEGAQMMVLPKVKNSRGKEIGIDIPESILNTMERQEKGKDVKSLEIKEAQRKVLNYKLFGEWDNPNDCDWVAQEPTQEVITEDDMRPINKLFKWVDSI